MATLKPENFSLVKSFTAGRYGTVVHVVHGAIKPSFTGSGNAFALCGARPNMTSRWHVVEGVPGPVLIDCDRCARRFKARIHPAPKPKSFSIGLLKSDRERLIHEAAEKSRRMFENQP